jgi:hypothetical protein
MEYIYESIFNFKYQHKYFDNNSKNIFTILPSHECDEILKGNRIIFKNLENGFILLSRYITNNENLKDMKKYFLTSFPKNTKFTFEIYCDDDCLLNYSALPYTKLRQKVFYMTNLDFNLDLSNHLIKDLVIGEKQEIRLVEKSGIISDINIKEIKDAMGNILDIKYVVQEIIDDTKQKKYLIDFSNLKPGLYTLKYNSNIKENVYFLGKGLFSKVPFAILEIFCDWDINEKNSIIKIDNKKNVQYFNSQIFNMNIDTRQVYWQYKIVGDVNPDKIRIVDNNKDNAIIFYKVTNDDKSILFRSQQPVMLNNIPKKNISLETNDEHSTTMIPNLPNPDVKNIYKDINQETFYTEIIVPV